VKDDPKNPLENLQHEVERLFHDLVYRRHPASHFAEPRWSPAADLVVGERSARVIFELAGVPRESVKVLLRGSQLEVSGRRSPPQEPAGTHYHRAEIYFGDFRRRVELPWDADETQIEAVYREGMLEVRLQRAPEPERKEIEIDEPEAR
jgi:HSP20 family protein